MSLFDGPLMHCPVLTWSLPISLTVRGKCFVNRRCDMKGIQDFMGVCEICNSKESEYQGYFKPDVIISWWVKMDVGQ